MPWNAANAVRYFLFGWINVPNVVLRTTWWRNEDMAPSGILDSRKILITGGSRGIGAACVKACVEQGADVAFTYKTNRDKAEMLIKDLGPAVSSYHADTSNLGDMEHVSQDFSGKGKTKGIDGLVINAGIYRRMGFIQMGTEDWSSTLRTNLDGAFIAVKAVLPHLVKGSIVMVSSQLAHKGSGYGADYSASKAGILGFSRSLARELAPNIRVNTVSPGYIDTEILAGDTEEKRMNRVSQVPIGRIGYAEDVAWPVVFLLSDMASYITGADLDVNGGLYIH
jgi:3-oxoacyl-[acyl-carrier protein] reductase